MTRRACRLLASTYCTVAHWRRWEEVARRESDDGLVSSAVVRCPTCGVEWVRVWAGP